MHEDTIAEGDAAQALDMVRALPTSALVLVLSERLAATGDVAVDPAEVAEAELLAARPRDSGDRRLARALLRAVRALVHRTAKLKAAEQRLADAADAVPPTVREAAWAAE